MIKHSRVLISIKKEVFYETSFIERKENADTVAKRELNENAKVNETFSFEIVEKYDSYTRAGEVISVDGVKYAIESTNHSYKDGWHFDKLELSKLE